MVKPPALLLAYVTAKNLREAKAIADRLLNDHLAACVHRLPGMRSFYRWKGKRISAQEVIVLAKTKKSLTKKFVRAVKEIHSYEVPCIVFLPIVGGNPEYLDWAAREVG